MFLHCSGTSKSAKRRSKEKEKERLGSQHSMSESDLAGSAAGALAQSSSTPNFQVHSRTTAVLEL
jgi:hypothetical protein